MCSAKRNVFSGPGVLSQASRIRGNGGSQPKAVRGMANEHLAMLRDPSVPEAARALSRADGYGATVWRARVIFSAPE